MNPKQNLTPFTRVLQAKLESPDAGPTDDNFAARFAREGTIRDADAAMLSQLQKNQSISTIEELAALARLDATQKTHFMADLGIPSDMARRLINALSKVRPDILADIERLEKCEYTLGCDLDFSSPPPTVTPLEPVAGGDVEFEDEPPAGPPPPTALNLIDSNMPPIRDQAARTACVAFASIACLEYHLRRFGSQADLDLSEQFHYWNLVTTANLDLESAYRLLASAGSCREITWPYYGKRIHGNDSQDPPPATAATEAMEYRCSDVVQMTRPRDISAIKAQLQRGRLVGIGIPVYASWYHSGIVRKTGNIMVPTPSEIAELNGHAMALVGYADDRDYAGGGYFILRNSWDSRWGKESVFGPGYGTIPYRFISKYNWEAWCIS